MTRSARRSAGSSPAGATWWSPGWEVGLRGAEDQRHLRLHRDAVPLPPPRRRRTRRPRPGRARRSGPRALELGRDRGDPPHPARASGGSAHASWPSPGTPPRPSPEAATSSSCIGPIEEACPMGLAPTASTAGAPRPRRRARHDGAREPTLRSRGVRALPPGREAGPWPGQGARRHAGRRSKPARRAVDATLGKAVAVMTKTPGRPGACSIVGDHGKLAGFFTDGDLRRLIERGNLVSSTPIASDHVPQPAHGPPRRRSWPMRPGSSARPVSTRCPSSTTPSGRSGSSTCRISSQRGFSSPGRASPSPWNRRTAVQSVNPATGEVLRQHPDHDDAEVERRLDRAAHLFPEYRRTSFEERARWLRHAGEILEREKASLRTAHDRGDGQDAPRPRWGRPRSAPSAAASTPRTRSGSWPTRSSPPTRAQLRALPAARRRSSRSCRGTSPSGRCSASRRRR